MSPPVNLKASLPWLDACVYSYCTKSDIPGHVSFSVAISDCLVADYVRLYSRVYACYSISEKSIPRFPYLGQLIEASGIIPKGPNTKSPYEGGILPFSLCRPQISLGPSGIIVKKPS
ncbi:hypothetical protein TEQG_04950 [Trichophyton equinum CBS 127.97]|uniref:Uncharacterized protein n=1 Tax=Trichophyton equinum (strain ATCC MYA-4606 / CBS 127.97) TaxID=559882 RepID=F2PVM5_TRIEC|nr:hypothetical protein TEQG_04950 [Trichophyton equinum CBS 127.97]